MLGASFDKNKATRIRVDLTVATNMTIVGHFICFHRTLYPEWGSHRAEQLPVLRLCVHMSHFLLSLPFERRNQGDKYAPLIFFFFAELQWPLSKSQTPGGVLNTYCITNYLGFLLDSPVYINFNLNGWKQ